MEKEPEVGSFSQFHNLKQAFAKNPEFSSCQGDDNGPNETKKKMNKIEAESQSINEQRNLEDISENSSMDIHDDLSHGGLSNSNETSKLHQFQNLAAAFAKETISGYTQIKTEKEDEFETIEGCTSNSIPQSESSNSQTSVSGVRRIFPNGGVLSDSSKMPKRGLKRHKRPGSISSAAMATSREDNRRDQYISEEELSDPDGWGPMPEKRFPGEKSKGLIFSDETEIDLAMWFRDHPIFYNKELKGFKDARQKLRLYKEKAASLNPPLHARELATWIKGMRTRFGRLTEPNASGKMTAREKWIVETFEYLRPHIVRVPHRKKRPNFKKKTIPPRRPFRPTRQSFRNAERTRNLRESSPNVTELTIPKQELQTDPDEDLNRLIVHVEEAAASQQPLQIGSIQNIPNIPSPHLHDNAHREAAEKWAGYLATQFADIHPALWDGFVQESLSMVIRYKRDSRNLLQQQQQHQQQQQQQNHQSTFVSPLGVITAPAPPPPPHGHPHPTVIPQYLHHLQNQQQHPIPTLNLHPDENQFNVHGGY